ncbi:hypothetical protein K4L06_15430 [Lysobacter sp. BMK333-48F3]|uniref:hypothetical protein n=1 Tax=Lysobacter sp. BMK333-48F3 TaxID=2867962 RepID=UPI001C8CD1F2|nr:hypothetical protein [Lysobacter sp. BMK333-48F3]MBX9402700.1 hypothetical protein [Lysobacter sp. BMK333-48F3]
MSSVSIQVSQKLRGFVRALKKYDELSAVIDVWNEVGEAYLFGGAPRDVAFGARKSINDLDIFVSGPVRMESINDRVSLLKKTNFGGYRFVVGQFDVDVWELDKSYAFRFDASSYINARNLLDSVCFSTDGVAVSLKTGRSIVTPEFTSSLADRRLDFVVPPAKLEAVIGARIARLALKLELELTPAVASYFVECLEIFGISALIDAETRWGSKRILNEISMEQIKLDIREAIRRARICLRNEY